jgi:hypothetical protein
MNERIRYESAERVRDFYRNQGAAKEKQRILEILGKLKSAPKCFELDVDALIALIKGENK